jgi:hypothetical protein
MIKFLKYNKKNLHLIIKLENLNFIEFKFALNAKINVKILFPDPSLKHFIALSVVHFNNNLQFRLHSFRYFSGGTRIFFFKSH